MEIKNLPEKYAPIWERSFPLLEKGRPGDTKHAQEVAKLILENKNIKKEFLDILIPVAIMHDIGHSMILPEHFVYVTGGRKIMNGKLVHMLVGAKIAHDILQEIKYDKEKSKEIIEIISMHDADQLKNIDLDKIYNTEIRKIFHDIDSLDRFTQERVDSMSGMFPGKSLIELLRGTLKDFFYEEFREIAEKQLNELKD